MKTATALAQATFVRAVALDDIRIRSGGTGRTVEAYAAVFDDPVEIIDQDGHYLEQNHKAAFTRTIAARSGRFPVVYHHGMTIASTPSERGSVPIGVSTSVRADSKGVLTVSEYGRSELADEVLEAIRMGAITGQSYGGRYLKSSPSKPMGGYRPGRSGGPLPLVTRLEVAMHEFGPTPFPAFAGASIVGVRAQMLAGALLTTPRDERAALLDQFDGLTTPEGDPEAQHLGTPSGPADQTATDPPRHSDRSIPLAVRIRAAKIARGME